MNLKELSDKEEAYVVEVEGGREFQEKMACMNIRQGKKLIKIMSQPLRGPIIVSVDNTQYAIGRGIASKIVVEKK
ncbi:MAG: FeoA family protein [Candidatus Nanoarchaeia archaeon]